MRATRAINQSRIQKQRERRPRYKTASWNYQEYSRLVSQAACSAVYLLCRRPDNFWNVSLTFVKSYWNNGCESLFLCFSLLSIYQGMEPNRCLRYAAKPLFDCLRHQIITCSRLRELLLFCNRGISDNLLCIFMLFSEHDDQYIKVSLHTIFLSSYINYKRLLRI